MKTRWIVVMTALLLVSAGCAATQPKTTGSLERGGWIAAKLAEADRLGAKECSPRTLAEAHVALEHAMHEAAEGYYPDSWLEPQFAAADTLAENLLAERRLAASLGHPFRCVSATRSSRAGSYLRNGAVQRPDGEDQLLPWPAGDYLTPSGGPHSGVFPLMRTAGD